MNTRPNRLIAFAATLLAIVSSVLAQGTAFTYQGRINYGSGPANGTYDLTFALHSAASGAAPVGTPVTANAMLVSNGLFIVTLDFGANVFTNGGGRWLEIGVRTNGGATFTTLNPRQPLTATPYAGFAANAGTAVTAGAVPGLTVNPGLSSVALGIGNTASAANATVGGGLQNNATGLQSTVGGGYFNNAGGDRSAVAGGYGNQAGGYTAFVGGGLGNRVGGNYAALVGGDNNVASGGGAFVGGGSANQATNTLSTVPGGENNLAGGQHSFAAGQRAKALHDGAFVWADRQPADFASTTTNQFSIRASGGVRLETGGAGLTVDGKTILTSSGGGQVLELSVNGQRALRLEPNSSGAPNVIGGSEYNSVSTSIVGATIGGGGATNYSGIIYVNSILSDFGTIGGGAENEIRANAINSTIGGGFDNLIEINGANSTVGGGRRNQVQANAVNSTIGGGFFNAIGFNASHSTVGGGYANNVSSSAAYSTIGGGHLNEIQPSAVNSTIGGGYLNQIQPGAQYATIPGGDQNSATNYAFAAGRQAKANHDGSFVWSDSQAADFSSTTSNQFNIRASGGVRLNNDTSLGFGNQTRQMINLWNAEYGIGVQGDAQYFRTGNDFFWYRGGSHSDITGDGGSGGLPLMSLTRSGRLGLGLTSPAYPLDARAGQSVGRFTTTNNANGAVLVLQNTTASPTYLGAINFETTSGTPGQIGYLASDQMVFRVGSADRMNLAAGGLTVNGTFVSSSDRNVKQDFAAVSPQEVLAKVTALPIQTWSYTNHPGAKHIGPMAQDFHAAFGLGTDDRHIATVDADGVALAAIQGLNQKVEEKNAEIADLKARLEKLERMLEAKGGAR